ncbi:MAG: DUF4332 domain-containing protein [Thermodesulfobacteriota bacterium]
MANVKEVEGIGKMNGRKLEKDGIRTLAGLLKRGADKKGRKAIAKNCKISEKLVLGWVNRADLCRIKGVASEYSDLLEKSGVDTVKELALRKAKNLHQKMHTVNKKKKLVRQLPSEKMVNKWIRQAKRLKRVVKY